MVLSIIWRGILTNGSSRRNTASMATCMTGIFNSDGGENSTSVFTGGRSREKVKRFSKMSALIFFDASTNSLYNFNCFSKSSRSPSSSISGNIAFDFSNNSRAATNKKSANSSGFFSCNQLKQQVQRAVKLLRFNFVHIGTDVQINIQIVQIRGCKIVCVKV